MDEDLKNLESLLRDVSQEEPSASLDERIRRLGEVHLARSRRRFERTRRWVGAASTAAAVCVGFLAGRISAPRTTANPLRGSKPPSLSPSDHTTLKQEMIPPQAPPRISFEMMLAMTTKARPVFVPRETASTEESSREPPPFFLDTDAPALEISSLQYD